MGKNEVLEENNNDLEMDVLATMGEVVKNVIEHSVIEIRTYDNIQGSRANFYMVY